MKRLPLLFALTIAGLAAGCSSAPPRAADAMPATAAAAPAKEKPSAPKGILVRDQQGSAVVEKVRFRVGESSNTVERLGKRFGCLSNRGAGLITEPGPVEVYRMQCDNGTTFMAECELRQCRPMR